MTLATPQQQGAIDELFQSEINYCSNVEKTYTLLEKKVAAKELKDPLISKMLEAYRTISQNLFSNLYEEREGIRYYKIEDGGVKTKQNLTEEDISYILNKVNTLWEEEEMQERLFSQAFIQIFLNHGAPFKVIERIKAKFLKENKIEEYNLFAHTPNSIALRSQVMELPLKELKAETQTYDDSVIAQELDLLFAKNKPWIQGPAILIPKLKISPSFDFDGWLQDYFNAEDKQAFESSLLNSQEEQNRVTQLIGMFDEHITELNRIKNKPEAKEVNQDAAITLLTQLKSNLEAEGASPLEKLSNFLDQANRKDKSGKNILYKTLKNAYKGETFWQKLKDFFGVRKKLENVHSFFKGTIETCFSPLDEGDVEEENAQKRGLAENLSYRNFGGVGFGN